MLSNQYINKLNAQNIKNLKIENPFANGIVAVGSSAGSENQDAICIALGAEAGRENQGEGSIAIGYKAGEENQGNK